MRPDPTPADGSVALASGHTAAAGAGQSDTAAVLPRLTASGVLLRLPRLGCLAGPLAARLAVASMLLGAFVLVAFATGAPSVLVPRSTAGFPHWEAGPLHYLLGHPTASYDTLNIGFSVLLGVMTIAYLIVLLAVRTLSVRTIAIVIVALHVILLLAPPMQLTDLFNYLGYARLGSVHHLNPYTHVIGNEVHDPIYTFTTWHNLRSPYGPLFTAISYPIAMLPIPVAYWLLKVLAVAGSLGFIALVWRCARLLGRDPRFAVVFVALNPVYLFYAVGGFHNDFFMLIPSTAAIALLLSRRDRSAGAVLMLAVAVKFTAILLLPFLLIAARPPERRLKVLSGALMTAVPLIGCSLALYGFSIPNLQDQSTLLTTLSVPNIVGLVLHVGGGTQTLLRVGNVALVLLVLLLLRRRRDWISSAGWATLGLLASLAWLVPWYIIWVLPLAALGTSIRLRRAAVVFSIFLVVTFVPAMPMFLNAHHLDPLDSPAGHASRLLQTKLAG